MNLVSNQKNFSHKLLNDLKFTVVDLETTGGNPEKDQIFEIGLIKIENLEITEERSFLLNPEKEIPDFVQKLTGVKTQDVLSAPKFREIIQEIQHFVGDSILVAHNISFDIPFLNAKLNQNQTASLENKVICTNVMTKHMIPDIVNSNLEYMGKIFSLGESRAHKAIDDARTTAKLLIKFLEIFENKSIKKINQLYYPRNRFELDRKHFENKNDTNLAAIKDCLQKENRPLTLSAKGSNGVIQTFLPLQDPHQVTKSVMELLEILPWQMITLKLVGPSFEAWMQLNNNYLKMPDNYRLIAYEWLKKNYFESSLENAIGDNDDFLVVPHLIQGQLTVHSLMSLSPFSQLIFKLPAHKKKFSHFIDGQLNRFEQIHKNKKKHQILTEILPFLNSNLQEMKQKKEGLFLSAKSYKKDSKLFMIEIEQFNKDNQNPFLFPQNYL